MFAAADNSLRIQVNRRWRIIVENRRQVIPSRVTPSTVIPVTGHAKYVIEVLLADHTERVQYFMLERPNHTLDESLQVR